jgi:adenylate cyclase
MSSSKPHPEPATPGSQSTQFSPQAIRDELERILSSPKFAGAEQIRRFLRFAVEKTVVGQQDQIKQYTIGTEALGRRLDFDPTENPIVRVEARRVRHALAYYYQHQGRQDAIRILMPKGTYVPVFQANDTNPIKDNSTARASSFAGREDPIPALPEGPGIVVLPFDLLTDNQDQVYFADGLAEMLVVALTRFPDFLIIGPLSRKRLRGQFVDLRAICRKYGADFALGGCVHKHRYKVRVTLTLFDASTGGTLWGVTYEKKKNVGDLLTFSDKIANQVAAVLADQHGIILRRLIRRTVAKSTKNLKIYEAILLHYHYVNVFSEKARLAAKVALESAIQIDPDHPLALAVLADWYKLEYVKMRAEKKALERAEDLAQQAVLLDPQCQQVRFIMATVYYFKGEHSLFISEAEQALSLNPNTASVVAACGFFLALTGEWDCGMRLVKKGMRLNPHHPSLYHAAVFMDYYRQGRYREALNEAMRIKTPSLCLDSLSRAAALGQLGMKKNAEAAVRELLTLNADFATRPRELMRRQFFSDENVEMLLDGLRKAGLERVHV